MPGQFTPPRAAPAGKPMTSTPNAKSADETAPEDPDCAFAFHSRIATRTLSLTLHSQSSPSTRTTSTRSGSPVRPRRLPGSIRLAHTLVCRLGDLQREDIRPARVAHPGSHALDARCFRFFRRRDAQGSVQEFHDGQTERVEPQGGQGTCGGTRCDDEGCWRVARGQGIECRGAPLPLPSES